MKKPGAAKHFGLFLLFMNSTRVSRQIQLPVLWKSLFQFPHICASVGRTAFIFRLLCSAASCLLVSPAHTPCISAAGNSSAYSRHSFFTGQVLQIALACAMYVMTLCCLGNMSSVFPLQLARLNQSLRGIASPNVGSVFLLGNFCWGCSSELDTSAPMEMLLYFGCLYILPHICIGVPV